LLKAEQVKIADLLLAGLPVSRLADIKLRENRRADFARAAPAATAENRPTGTTI